jgi:hypothetical protein
MLYCVVFLFAGDVIALGRNNLFRFNHPAEARKLKQMRKVSQALLTITFKKQCPCLYMQFLHDRKSKTTQWQTQADEKSESSIT